MYIIYITIIYIYILEYIRIILGRNFQQMFSQFFSDCKMSSLPVPRVEVKAKLVSCKTSRSVHKLVIMLQICLSSSKNPAGSSANVQQNLKGTPNPFTKSQEIIGKKWFGIGLGLDLFILCPMFLGPLGGRFLFKSITGKIEAQFRPSSFVDHLGNGSGRVQWFLPVPQRDASNLDFQT